MEAGTTPGWWREEGDERCPFCLQATHREEIVHCTGCDSDGCVRCVVLVRETTSFHCPECPTAGEED